MGNAITALRRDLIDKLTRIEDPVILEEVARLLNTSVKEEPYVLSMEARREVTIAREEIAKGYSKTADEADSEIDQWLTE